LGTFLILALFDFWFVIASGYDYSDLAGTYDFKDSNEAATLYLKSDHTFQEEITHSGRVDHAQGTWDRSGMAGVEFSAGFIKVPGAKTYAEEFPDHLYGNPEDHQYFGRFEKILGIYPTLHMNANPPGPTFHKRLFS